MTPRYGVFFGYLIVIRGSHSLIGLRGARIAGLEAMEQIQMQQPQSDPDGCILSRSPLRVNSERHLTGTPPKCQIWLPRSFPIFKEKG